MDLALAPVVEVAIVGDPRDAGDRGAHRRDAARLPSEPGHGRRRRSGRQRHPADGRAGRHRWPSRPPTSAAISPAGSRSAMPRRSVRSSTPRWPVADAARRVHDPGDPPGRVRGVGRGDGSGVRRRPGRRRRLPPATPERGAAGLPHPRPGRRRCRRPRARWRRLRPGAWRAICPSRSAATRPVSGCSRSTRRSAGRGIGRALAVACIDRARAAGRSGVAILTRPSRPVAHRPLHVARVRARPEAATWSTTPGRWLWSFVLTFEEPA